MHVSWFLLKWPFTLPSQGVEVAVQPVPPSTISELRIKGNFASIDHRVACIYPYHEHRFRLNAMVSPMANSYLDLFIYEASVLGLILLSPYKNSIKLRKKIL